jgi:type III secretion protein HrpB1
MDGKPDYMKCSNKLVSAMREVVRLALLDKFPNPRMESDEAEHLLDALHVMRPERPELVLYDGFVHIVHRNWIDAIAVFESLAARGECMPGSKAMLVYCLAASGNADWRIVASQMRASENSLTEDARVLLDSVELRDDLERANRDAQVTGTFHMTDSMKRLRERLNIKLPSAEEAAQAEDASASPGPFATPEESQYLRL